MKLASVCLVACWCLMALAKADEVEAAAVEAVDVDGVEELPIDDRDDAEMDEIEQEAVDLPEDRGVRCPRKEIFWRTRCSSSWCKRSCTKNCEYRRSRRGRYGCKNSTQSYNCRLDCKKSIMNWQKYLCQNTMCKFRSYGSYARRWRRLNK